MRYDFLVVALGVTLHYDHLPGLGEHLGRDGICSIYTPEQAEKTWQTLQSFQGGTALFTMPATPVKCGGAPLKITYLAEDYFARTGKRDKAEVIFASPYGKIFGIEAYARTLTRLAEARRIVRHFHHRLIEVQPDKRRAVFAVTTEKRVGGDIVKEERQIIIMTCYTSCRR